MVVIKNSQVCVLSILADRKTCQQNGVYILDEKDQTCVRKIYFKPDNRTLEKYNKNEDNFNLVSALKFSRKINNEKKLLVKIPTELVIRKQNLYAFFDLTDFLLVCF